MNETGVFQEFKLTSTIENIILILFNNFSRYIIPKLQFVQLVETSYNAKWKGVSKLLSGSVNVVYLIIAFQSCIIKTVGVL